MGRLENIISLWKYRGTDEPVVEKANKEALSKATDDVQYHSCDVPVGPVQFVCRLEQGNIPERSHSYTYVSFHNAGFIREDFLNKLIASYTDCSR